MARPSRTGGKTSEAKARNASPAKGRKTTKTKPRIAPAATRVKRRSVSDPSKDLKEAREQQAATAEILKVIASSPDDVQPVFEAIVASANRLIGGFSTAVYRFVDGILSSGGLHAGQPGRGRDVEEPVSAARPNLRVFDRRMLAERSARSPTPKAEPSAVERIARGRAAFEAVVCAPDEQGNAIGVIAVSRRSPGVFSASRRIAADLRRPGRDRHRERAAVQRDAGGAGATDRDGRHPEGHRQFAVGRAAGVRGHRGAIEPAGQGLSTTVYSLVDDTLHLMAFTPTSPEADAALQASFPGRCPGFPGASGSAGAKSSTSPTPKSNWPNFPSCWKWRGCAASAACCSSRCCAKGPYRHHQRHAGDAGWFADHHVQLLQTFADQAVIAIENVRLFDEVQAKTRDLSEALTYQTGSSNILSVIASSPTDVGPVLQAIVESACELCDAYDAIIASEGRRRARASRASRSDTDEPGAMAQSPNFALRTRHRRPRASAPSRHAFRRRRGISESDRRCRARWPSHHAECADAARRRKHWNDRASSHRSESVQRQTDRLAADLRRSGGDRHRQCPAVRGGAGEARATSRSRWSSRPPPRRCSRSSAASPGELEPVFQKMLENATRVCGANFGTMTSVRRQAASPVVALYNVPHAFADAAGHALFRPHPQSGLGRYPEPNRSFRSRHADSIALPRRRSRRHRDRPISREREHSSRTDAQGRRIDRRHRDLPSGSPAVHRQADRRWSPTSPSRP